MRTDSLALPVSIFLGCTVIAAALYLGLTSAPAEKQLPQPPGSSSALVSAAVQPASTPVNASSTLSTSVTPIDEISQRVQVAARLAIEKEKKETYIPKCWEPALKANPTPSTSKHIFQLSFDAQGRESVRGLNDVRGQARNDVSMCVQRVPMGIRISPPPGVAVNVEVPLDFP